MELAAKQGHAKAEIGIGDFYLGGWGVQEDTHVAATWYQKAAQQGNIGAQTKLGILYLSGRGIEQDYSTAASWLSKAAEQGDHEAQAKLASLYEKGRGVPHDLNRAYFWRSLSLDGDSKPVNELRQLAHYMTDDDIADSEWQASEWRRTHKDVQIPELDIAPPNP